MSLRHILAPGVLALCAALLATACGGDEDAAGTATPTAAATVVTATGATPGATTAATKTAPAASVTGTAPAASATSAIPEKPRVLWMLRDHGGTNLAVVRFATNNETTAVLSLFGSPGQPTGVEPQRDMTFAREHTISIPLGQGGATALSLTVTDRSGQQASAILEYGATIVGTQYFGRAPGFAPKFTFSAPYRGTATWSAISSSTPLPLGTVQVFAKQPGCTTAQQCQATLESTAAQDTRTSTAGGESHSIPVTLPSSPAKDFQLLYTVVFDSGAQPVSTVFYQVDILAAAAAAAAAGTN